MCDVAYSCMVIIFVCLLHSIHRAFFLLPALIYSSWYWQHYIVNVQLDKEHVSEGLETAGLPEGIISMPEFLLEYCSASVSPERHVMLKKKFIYASRKGTESAFLVSCLYFLKF